MPKFSFYRDIDAYGLSVEDGKLLLYKRGNLLPCALCQQSTLDESNPCKISRFYKCWAGGRAGNLVSSDMVILLDCPHAIPRHDSGKLEYIALSIVAGDGGASDLEYWVDYVDEEQAADLRGPNTFELGLIANRIRGL